MPPAASTRTGVPARAPISHPEVESGALLGDYDPEANTDENRVRIIRERLYDLTRTAVDVWGGPSALASYWRCALSNISTRLNRKEVNGSLQYAFLDFLAIACSHPAAAEAVVIGLCDLFGYEHPQKKRTKTDAEKFRSLVKSLRTCGPLGDAAIRQAAHALGADVAEFEL